MSKELETVKGIDVNQHYHSKELDNFSRVMLSTMKGNSPLKHSYYELVNKKGKVVQIVDTTDKVLIQSAAYRLGLDYRLVEFNETWIDLDAEKEEQEKCEHSEQ